MRLAFVLLIAVNIAVLLWGVFVQTPTPPFRPPTGGDLQLIGESDTVRSAVTAAALGRGPTHR